jgi:hypothetical protein
LISNNNIRLVLVRKGVPLIYKNFNSLKMQNFSEEFRVKGEEVVEKVKQLIHEGNVRRLIIKDESGKVYLDIPVTYGIVGALIAPMLAAVGAVAAVAANLKIEVVRDEEPADQDKQQST